MSRDRIGEVLDLTAPIQTRDGRAARLLSTTEKHKNGGYHYPLKAEVEHPNKPGRWKSWFYMRDGSWVSNDPFNNNDLVNVRRQGMN